MSHSSRTAVVVLNWNGLQYTRACVESLLAQTTRDVEIHIVDNGSDNAEAESLAHEYGDRIQLHAFAENLGFAGGCNAAIEPILATSDCEFIALLNNDAVAEPDWIAQLVAVAGSDCGAVASRMCLYRDPERLDGAGVWLLSNGDATPRGRLEPASTWDQEDSVLLACGGAVLLRCAMLREIGLFRTDFFANFEDMDLFLRASVAGYRIRYAPRASVRHHLNATILKVRDRAFDIRSVRNATWATFVNLPWPVLLLNLPWFLLSNLAIVLLMPLCGRPGVAIAFLRGRLRALAECGAIWRERRRLAPLRRAPWWRIWWRQRSFALEYLRMLSRRRRGQRRTLMARPEASSR